MLCCGIVAYAQRGVPPALINYPSTITPSVGSASGIIGTLTAGRVPYASGSHTLVDSAAFKFDGSLLAPIADKGGQVFNVLAYGIVAGDVDIAGANSTAMLALLETVNTAGGGTIYFPPGVYRFDSQLLLPNDGGSPRPIQANIRLTGAGGGQNWYAEGNTTYGTSVLDLRYNGGNIGKIETLGRGALQIDNLVLFDGGTDNNAFIHSTHTVLTIHDSTFIGTCQTPSTQDAIVLGGSTATDGPTTAAPFSGYGTLIQSNHFNCLNRGLYAKTFANNIQFLSNSFQGNTGTIAIEANGSLAAAQLITGLNISGNLIQMDQYTYGVKLTAVQQSNFTANSFPDIGGGALFLYYLIDPSTANVITLINGADPASDKDVGGDTASLLWTTILGASGRHTALRSSTTGSEFSNGAIFKGVLHSTDAYPGQLSIISRDASGSFLTLAYDTDNDGAIIDTNKISVGGQLLRLNTTNNGQIATGSGLFTLGGDLAVANGKALKTDTTTAHTALLQAYDTNTGPAYVTFGTLLNGDAPSLTFAPPAGGGTMNFQGIYKSNDGTAGLTQTCASAVVGVTIKNGLITAVTCP